LSRAVWDDQRVQDLASAWAVNHLGDGDAVLIVDETADEKPSTDAAGAARQYSGTVGGIALCQVAVTLTYATGRGLTERERELRSKTCCRTAKVRRRAVTVLAETVFRRSEARRPARCGSQPMCRATP
jgi:SRSO17 transposase